MRALGIGDAMPHQLTGIDDDMFLGICYSAFRSVAMVSGLHDPTLVLDRVPALVANMCGYRCPGGSADMPKRLE